MTLSSLMLRALSTVYRVQRSLARRSAAARLVQHHRSEFYDRVWRDAACELGAELRTLGPHLHEVDLDGEFTRVSRNYTSLDDPVTLDVAGNKPLVYRLLSEAGLPIPQHRKFTPAALATAADFLRHASGPCVVKPAKDTGAGNGVTTGVLRRAGLFRATAAAAVYGPELLIEEQIAGDSFRLLYLEGQLLDAIRRTSPTVVADGRSTVKGLVEHLNLERVEQGAKLSQVLVTIDLEMRHTLATQGLRLGSVPEAGRRIVLKTVSNENLGCENMPATDLLCRDVIEAGARAAEVVGARLAGVDIVTPDPSVPLVESGGVILEVNTTPGYYYHYHQSGEPFPVAVHVLRRLLQSRANLHTSQISRDLATSLS
jgi:D-alanine-D-alanine ligase-like ATP-grasp enzyme